MRFLAASMAACCLIAALPAQRIRPKVRDPLARFTKMLGRENARAQWQAVRGLVRLGDAAVPNLLHVLEVDGREDPPPPQVELAAEAMARLGRHATSAIPRLVELARKGTDAQRFGAIHALGHIAPFDQASVDKVREAIIAILCLETTHRTEWPRIAPAIARLSSDPSKVGMKELHKRLTSRDVTQRLQAAEWLAGRIAAGSTKAAQRKTFLDRLTTAIRERQPRHTAFDYMFQSEDFRRVVQTHRAIEVRCSLAEIVLRHSPELPLPGWVALASHRDPALRQRAALALGASGDRDAVPALVEQLSDGDKVVVFDAITALGMLGPRAKAAREALQSIAQSDDKGRAARARAALARIGT